MLLLVPLTAVVHGSSNKLRSMPCASSRCGNAKRVTVVFTGARYLSLLNLVQLVLNLVHADLFFKNRYFLKNIVFLANRGKSALTY